MIKTAMQKVANEMEKEKGKWDGDPDVQFQLAMTLTAPRWPAGGAGHASPTTRHWIATGAILNTVIRSPMSDRGHKISIWV